MPRDLADEAALFVEIHSLEVRFVASEDLIGFGDHPDLHDHNYKPVSLGHRFITARMPRIVRTSELSSSMAGRGRYWTGFRLKSTYFDSVSLLNPSLVPSDARVEFANPSMAKGPSCIP